MRIKNTMNYDQNEGPTVFFHNHTFSDTCRHTKNKSRRSCRLYFRGRMHCWWIFDFETNYRCIIVSYLDLVPNYILNYPTPTRRHGNFAGVHTLLRILLSSNSAVLINIITGVSPPHFDFVVYYVLCQC
jgi:hypothetical protein